MSFNDLLKEAKLSQDRILEAIINQKKENAKIKETKKQQQLLTFDDYYQINSESIAYKDSISYEQLEEKETCDQVNYKKCLNKLKQYNIIVHAFYENDNQKEYNINHEEFFKVNKSLENTDLFTFICRFNEWFFIVSFNVHGFNMSKRFECKKFYNSLTKESMDLRCTLLYESQQSCRGNKNDLEYHDYNVDLIFEIIKSSLSYNDFMNQKWIFLNFLSEQLNIHGFKNIYERKFELYPDRELILITEPVNIMLSYEFYPEPIIIIVEGDDSNKNTIMKTSYKSLDDYNELKKLIELYILYVKNQYGEYDESHNLYYNDKDICNIFNNIQLIHKKKYKQCNESSHGLMEIENRRNMKFHNIEYESSVKDKEEPNDSKFYLNGIDLINDVFCDVHYIVNFGQNMIKHSDLSLTQSNLQSTRGNLQSTQGNLQSTLGNLQSTEGNLQSTEGNLQLINESKSKEENAEKTIWSHGEEYEKYRFSVKMYKKDSRIVTKFLIEQFDIIKKSNENLTLIRSWQGPENKLKNKFESEGLFHEIQGQIKESIFKIYQIYNMPLE